MSHTFESLREAKIREALCSSEAIKQRPFFGVVHVCTACATVVPYHAAPNGRVEPKPHSCPESAIH